MKRPFLKLTLLGWLIGLTACQPAPSETELAGAIQGTTYHIKLVLDDVSAPTDLDQLRQAIDAAFSAIDLKLSNYRDDSEISQLNQNATTDWQPVSKEIALLTAMAKQVYQQTDGCYDLTIKPLFDLWGFSKHDNRIPNPQEIAQVQAHVGMSRVEIDLDKSMIRRLDPQIRIDMSSIAQGYSVEVIASLLEQQGIQNYLVEIGGEMKVKGHKANGKPWRVAIEKPTPFTREIEKILDIHQQNGTAIMTAGTYRNFFEEKGQVYSHILDPRTGRPVTHHLLSVTVLHEDPTWADTWDTALLCVGEQAAMRIVEEQQIKALLIYQDGQELKEYMSSALIAEQTAPATPAAAN